MVQTSLANWIDLAVSQASEVFDLSYKIEKELKQKTYDVIDLIVMD